MSDPESFEKLVEQRRRALDAPDVPPDGGRRIWGLALSGGGIRSATFCLGLLKALAQQRMLLRFDLLSTVSGGGYVGATLGRLFSRAGSADEVKQVAAAVGDADGRWFTWWLRANGRYLIPRGAKDTTFAIALYLRNITGVHFELGLLALLLGVALALFDVLAWTTLGYLGYAADGFFDAARYVPHWLPAMALLLPVVMLIGAVEASAYWCVPWLTDPTHKRWHALSYWAAGVACALALRAFHGWLETVQTDVGAPLRTAFWWTAMLIAVAWVFSVPMAAYVLRRAQQREPDPRLSADLARNRLTRWIANALRAAAVMLLLGLVDRFAWFLAFEVSPAAQAGAGLALGVLAAVARALLPSIASLLQQRTKTPSLLIGRIVGYALTFLLCSWWVSLVHRAALGAAFQRHSPNFGATLVVLAVIGTPVVAYLLLTARNLKFLNLSSLHAFYWARLVRSYLGAANGLRFKGAGRLDAIDALPRPMPVSPTLIGVSDIQRDDDIAFEHYAPQRHGGPIHIINVCVNQTRDPRGGLFNQDRRGLAMSIASSGQMRVSQDAWRALPPNALTLGRWTAISGAAIAPGLGSLSRGGISALATFAGLRLGYWWNKDEGASEASATTRPSLLAKSAGLLRETFGIFRGIDRREWFLTDGGHFENTAAYSLLAQRAEIIVLADCGADPEYGFKDLENLVRKARIDLQAEISFQRPKKKPAAVPTSAPEPAPAAAWPPEMKVFGSLSDLASPSTSCCLALARVDYHGDESRQAILIVVKPNVSDGLPVDLVNFKAHNPAFPQEATADQFFSEAQWESYYALGKFLGGQLTRTFVESLPDKWSEYFEADEQSPIAGSAASGATEKPAPAGARLPARIGAATAVGATLGLGAVATLGVSLWQAIDSYRTASAKQVADERAALKELTDLWAKVPPAAAAASGAASVGALAAAIVRTADTLCPANEAGWFQKSVVAETVYQSALKQCAGLDKDDRPQACTALLEAAHPTLQNRLPDCLGPQEGLTLAIPPPRYWVFDYGADAPFARAHPCDPRALERKVADDQYRSGRLRLDAAYSSNDAEIAAITPKECGAEARWSAQLRAAFTGVREPQDLKLADAAPAAPVPPPPPSAAPQPDKPGLPAAPEPNAAAPVAAAPAAKPADRVCEGRTVYIQIYGPQQRELARSYREPWRQLGATIPPIEDVTASARSAGRTAARPVARTTVRVHDAASFACARALAPAAGQSGWVVEPLSRRLRATPGVVEVWIAPAAAAAN